MGHQANHKDGGKLIKSELCGLTNIVAAGAGDNTEVTGLAIDRMPPGGSGDNGGFLSAEVAVMAQAVLGAGESLDLQVELEESDDGSTGWTLVEELRADTEFLASVGGGTERGTFRANVNLAPRKRYVRVNFTPDLSAGSTDTAVLSAQLVLAGAISPPV